MSAGYWRASIRLSQKGRGLLGGGEVKVDRRRVVDGGGDEKSVFVIKENDSNGMKTKNEKGRLFTYAQES